MISREYDIYHICILLIRIILKDAEHANKLFVFHVKLCHLIRFLGWIKYNEQGSFFVCEILISPAHLKHISGHILGPVHSIYPQVYHYVMSSF